MSSLGTGLLLQNNCYSLLLLFFQSDMNYFVIVSSWEKKKSILFLCQRILVTEVLPNFSFKTTILYCLFRQLKLAFKINWHLKKNLARCFVFQKFLKMIIVGCGVDVQQLRRCPVMDGYQKTTMPFQLVCLYTFYQRSDLSVIS